MDEKELIRKWLTKNGLKAYQLAEKAGVSYPIIYRFLQGKRDIRLATLNKIKAAMK